MFCSYKIHESSLLASCHNSLTCPVMVGRRPLLNIMLCVPHLAANRILGERTDQHIMVLFRRGRQLMVLKYPPKCVCYCNVLAYHEKLTNILYQLKYTRFRRRNRDFEEFYFETHKNRGNARSIQFFSCC